MHSHHRDARRLRPALLATSGLVAVVGVAAFAASSPARADCQTSANTITCTDLDLNGNVGGGTASNFIIAVQQPLGVIAAPTGTPAVSVLTGNSIFVSGAALSLQGDGVRLNGDNNLVVNGGTLTTGDNGCGCAATVRMAGNGNVLVNSGTVNHKGIDLAAVFVTGASNTILNTGLIREVGATAAAVGGATNNPATVFNQGLIVNTVGGPAVALGAFAIAEVGSTLINSGTIDGQVSMRGFGTFLQNDGLITVSSPANGSFAAHFVDGPFVQGQGGTLSLRVGPNKALGYDTLSVNATVTLGGTLNVAPQPGVYQNKIQYFAMITAANGLSGTFAAVTAPVFFTATAIYTNGNTQVDVLLTRQSFGSVPGSTRNHIAVGTALESVYTPEHTGAAASLYSALLSATSLTALDALSGEIGTGAQSPSFAMGGAFLGAMQSQAQRWRMGSGAGAAQSAGTRIQFASANPFVGATHRADRSDPPGSPYPRDASEIAQARATHGSPLQGGAGRTWGAWASGFGLGGSQNGDAGTGSARLSYSMGGAAAGFDVQLNPRLLLGVSAGGAGSGFSLAGQPASGTARTMFVGAYGSWTIGPLYVDAAASYGHAQFTTTRTITVGSTSELAEADFGGHQYGGSIEAGWRFALSRYQLTPFAAVAVQALRQDGISETTRNVATDQPGTMGLAYAAETTTSVRSFLGAQAATTFALSDRTTLTPRLRLAWAHEFNRDRQVNASFLSLPGAAFTVAGARPARDAAIVSAGLDLGLGRNVALYAQFDGDLSGSGNAYAGSGGIRVSW